MKPQNYPLKRMQATHVRPARPDLSVAITHIVPTKGKKLSNFLDNLPGIILGELELEGKLVLPKAKKTWDY